MKMIVLFQSRGAAWDFCCSAPKRPEHWMFARGWKGYRWITMTKRFSPKRSLPSAEHFGLQTNFPDGLKTASHSVFSHYQSPSRWLSLAAQRWRQCLKCATMFQLHKKQAADDCSFHYWCIYLFGVINYFVTSEDVKHVLNIFGIFI